MTSFEFDMKRFEMDGIRHISKVGRLLAATFVRKARDRKLTKAELAEALEVDRSVVSRMLRGDANLTLRSVGELCAAMGVELELDVKDIDQPSLNRPVVTVAPGAQREFTIKFRDLTASQPGLNTSTPTIKQPVLRRHPPSASAVAAQ